MNSVGVDDLSREEAAAIVAESVENAEDVEMPEADDELLEEIGEVFDL